MSQHRYAFFVLPVVVFVSLASFVTNTAAAKVKVPAHALASDTIAATAVSAITPSTQPAELTVRLAQATGNLLSSEQKAQLTQLPIPIVAPTNLPASFRLVRAEGEVGKYANGDDDSGYAIDYQGEQNTCLSIRTSQDGPRGLETVKRVTTRFGLVTVYAEKRHDRKSLVSFLGIKGNPILISGGVLPDSKANGGWKPCRAVSVETYTQVLRSLSIVK